MQEPSTRIRLLCGKAFRLVAPRLLVFGGLALLALLLLGELRWVPPDRLMPFSVEEATGDQVASQPGWPHLRGPNHDSTTDATGLIERWPAEGPPVLWVGEIGLGYSGFTAAGGRVYTQRQTLYGQSVVCLDADRGNILWETRYGWPHDAAGMYPGPRATPTWHDGRVYFLAPDGLTGCLDARDGRMLWSRNVQLDFDGRGTDFGHSASPTIDNGKVILPVGGLGASVVALDAQNGSTVWASGDEPASYVCAKPITVGGQRLMVLLLQNVLALVEPSTGQWLWQHRLSAGYDERAAMPLFEEPYLMVTHPFRRGADVFEIQLAAANEADGQGGVKSPELNVCHVRTIRQMSNDVASSILIDGRVYGFDLRDLQSKARRPSRGEFRCLDLVTGEILWSTDRVGHASVIHADGKLILFNDRGELLLVRPAADGYHELARTQVFEDEICWTAPALHRRRLYLRSPTRAACIYLGDPSELASAQAARARPASEIRPAPSVDYRWLVGARWREAPDRPTRDQLVQWYLVILMGGMIPAAVLAISCRCIGQILHRDLQAASHAIFWLVLLLAGVALTAGGNLVVEGFLFTWPLVLFVAQHFALAAVLRARHRLSHDAAAWVAAVGTLVFFAICLIYFHLCRRLDLDFGWAFLLGFLPSWPVAVPLAWKVSHRSSLLVVVSRCAYSVHRLLWGRGRVLLVESPIVGPGEGPPIEIGTTSSYSVAEDRRMNKCRVSRKGSGVVFGEAAVHVVDRCPKTTPDPVAHCPSNPTLIVLPILGRALTHLGTAFTGSSAQRMKDSFSDSLNR
jgi:outer membrane protein assembly factor BamB